VTHHLGTKIFSKKYGKLLVKYQKCPYFFSFCPFQIFRESATLYLAFFFA